MEVEEVERRGVAGQAKEEGDQDLGQGKQWRSASDDGNPNKVDWPPTGCQHHLYVLAGPAHACTWAAGWASPNPGPPKDVSPAGNGPPTPGPPGSEGGHWSPCVVDQVELDLDLGAPKGRKMAGAPSLAHCRMKEEILAQPGEA
jgi:hypothetical protein